MLKLSLKGAPVIDRLTFEVLGYAYADIVADLNAVLDLPDLDADSAAGILIAALREKCKQKSSASLQIAKEKTPGRPKSKASPIACGIINSPALKPKRLPGRPNGDDPGYAIRIYKIVESQRQALAKQGKKSTIVAAIDSLNEYLASSKGVRAHTFKNSVRNSDRAIYNRGRVDQQEGSKTSD